MKNILFAITASLLMVTIMGCDEYENSAEPSVPTFLPKLTMNGPSFVALDCNASGYDDPGLKAEEQGTEIPVTTSVTGQYFGGSSIDGPDEYSIVYSAENKDGIPGAAERTVVWPPCEGDFVNSIAGVYTANSIRDGDTSPTYQGLGPIYVKDLGNGEFQISDAIGGYYDYGRKYGFHYAATGFVVKANDIAGNSWEFADQVVGVGDFGGELVMTNFSIDPATKTISFTTEWSFGYVFEVTMTQN